MPLLTDDIVAAARDALAACDEMGVTLVTAESCTGGLVSAALTAVPGSSAVFEAGFVTYANSAKENILNVAPSLIRTQGAVSRDVAFAMARGALTHTSARLAVAITGVAGPDGGTSEKPVGLVHIAVCSEDGDSLHDAPVFSGDRDSIRAQATVTALRMISKVLREGTV
ncbi:MAG: CinA family protein [Rhodospirillaceae bacterium]